MLRLHLKSLFVVLTVACTVLALNTVPSDWEPSEWNMMRSNQRSWGWPLQHYAEYDRGFIAPMPLWWDNEPSDNWFIPITAAANTVIGVVLVLVAALTSEWLARWSSRRRNARRLRMQRLASR
jgi:hypothetical protein